MLCCSSNDVSGRGREMRRGGGKRGEGKEKGEGVKCSRCFFQVDKLEI